MKAIYEALYAIDKNVMVYGEPWAGGSSPVVKGIDKTVIDQCWTTLTQNGVACFNDSYRNAIKGGEFGGFQQGQVQGTFNPTAIANGLKGSPEFTDLSDRSLNYVECHDNYTLFDKLDISINGGNSKADYVAYDDMDSAYQNAIRAQNKLAAAYVFLAQGTPFINGGQEFMRTKQGDENSYVSSDEINGIDLSFKTKFADVYCVYKGLIALRQAHSVFRKANSVTVKAPKSGVTRYSVSDGSEEFIVIFNASDKAYSVACSTVDADLESAIPYLIDTGIPIANPSVTNMTAAAHSFTIYKTK
jgi:pullulanase